jgi:hypothetical protein
MYSLVICISFKNYQFINCIFLSLVFWAPYIFWLLIPCQTNSWQRFSPILKAVSLFEWLFPLLYRSFLVWCNPIFQCLLLFSELLESYSESLCLYLYLKAFLLFLVLILSEFRTLTWCHGSLVCSILFFSGFLVFLSLLLSECSDLSTLSSDTLILCLLDLVKERWGFLIIFSIWLTEISEFWINFFHTFFSISLSNPYFISCIILIRKHCFFCILFEFI